MGEKFFGLLIIFLLSLFLPPKVFAEGEFSTSYDVTYDVDPSGLTDVAEKITLRNLTDNFYASSFALTIGSTNVADVSASDSGGTLDTAVENQGNKSKINVKFTSQIAGKDKTYSWVLKFKSPDFATKEGKIWQISIPKIASVEGVENYNLVLSVPVEFGDPSSIQPEPIRVTESGGKINLFFDKNELTDAGLLANFGTEQSFKFKLFYRLTNDSILPTVAGIALPPDTNFQKVSIENINPRPETVTLDQDGNYLATFKLNRNQNTDVEVDGLGKVFINSQEKIITSLSQVQESSYLQAQRYWEKDNPLMEGKLADIFKDTKPSSVREQAKLINKFVVNNLKFDPDRLKQRNFTRLGALTALNNPDSSLAADFTDLFITLARAAEVPSRELEGYAYSPNTDIRPLSFAGTNFHSWPEYFDLALGWVMIDPTWQETTGGVDYFSKFDLNHLVLAIHGSSSTFPPPPNRVEVDFYGGDFNPKPNLNFSLDAPSQIFSGFPANAFLTIINLGSSVSPQTIIKINSEHLSVNGGTITVPALPPFGKISYSFDLRSKNLWQAFDDSISVSTSNQLVSQKISVKPFFAFHFFPFILLGLSLLMISLYMLSLKLHINRVSGKI